MNKDYLLELFDYDKDNGKLYWKKRPLRHFAREKHCKRWNTVHANKEAGHISKHNDDLQYRRVLLPNGKKMLAHRIIWQIEKSKLLKKDVIDHIDGNGLNNKIENLRLTNNSGNQKNRKLNINSTSKIKGVYISDNRIFAQIGSKENKKSKTFKTIEEAICWRKNQENKRGYLWH